MHQLHRGRELVVGGDCSSPNRLIDCTARALAGRSSSHDRRVASIRTCTSAKFPASDARFVGCGLAEGAVRERSRGGRERRQGCSCWASSGCCGRMSRCSRRCWRAGGISSCAATWVRRRCGGGWRGGRFQRFTRDWPWRWRPVEPEEFTAQLRGERRARSTSGPTTAICACSASSRRPALWWTAVCERCSARTRAGLL